MHAMGELVIHRTAVEALTTQLNVAGLQQAVQELTRTLTSDLAREATTDVA